MRKFRLKAPLVVNILIAVCQVLSALGAGWNIFNVYQYHKIDTIKTVCFSVAIGLSLLLFIFSISFYFSKYIVKGKTLVCYTGFLRSKLNLEGLSIIHFVEKSKKTFLVFENGDALTIMIAEKDFYDFGDEVMKEIPLIELRRTEDLK